MLGGTGLGSALVVDGDDEVRNYVAKVLRAEGLAVEAVSDAYQALAAVAASHFDVLVTDLLMPGATGLDLMAKLGERRLTLPAVVMTDAGPGGLTSRARAAGAVAVIAKPLTERAVIDAVALVLRKASVSVAGA